MQYFKDSKGQMYHFKDNDINIPEGLISITKEEADSFAAEINKPTLEEIQQSNAIKLVNLLNKVNTDIGVTKYQTDLSEESDQYIYLAKLVEYRRQLSLVDTSVENMILPNFDDITVNITNPQYSKVNTTTERTNMKAGLNFIKKDATGFNTTIENDTLAICFKTDTTDNSIDDPTSMFIAFDKTTGKVFSGINDNNNSYIENTIFKKRTWTTYSSGERTVGTYYTNDTDYDIEIAITLPYTSVSDIQLWQLKSGNSVLGQGGQGASGTSQAPTSINATVPSGASYVLRHNSGKVGTYMTWAELRG